MTYALAATWLALYALPIIVAEYRGHLNLAPICGLNLLLGWTLIGWAAALVMALSGDTRKNVAVRDPKEAAIRTANEKLFGKDVAAALAAQAARRTIAPATA